MDNLVNAFLVVTALHGAAGQPMEVCMSRCVAGIEWASGTVISSKLFCFVLWILNCVSSINCGDVLGVRSTRDGISTFVYKYKREVFLCSMQTLNLVKWTARRGSLPLP